MTLEERRAKRWWLTRPQIRTLARAAEFIDDVGFAMLWPKKGHPLPSLWVAGSDRARDELAEDGEWGPDAQRMWGWKDEIPLKGLAWYGPFVRGGRSFLSLDLLADLYPHAGKAEDYRSTALSRDASQIADVILAGGPTAAAVLREATGLQGKRGGVEFTKAVTELGRALVITHYGVEEQGSGWPSAVYELTARAFKLHPKGSPEKRRLRAAKRFLDTMIAARMPDLRYAFNWTALDARAALDALARNGDVRFDRNYYWTD